MIKSTKMRARRWVATTGAVLALGVGTAAIANAATSPSAATTTTATAVNAANTAPANAPDPATVAHGPGETLLTGSDLAKATAAAQSAVPGGTIIRVETDSGGATYEAHLTGDTAAKVKAAALAKVPGTVERVETNVDGSAPYEAHIKKADGTTVTVKLDAAFNVTATESGFGSGPGHP